MLLLLFGSENNWLASLKALVCVRCCIKKYRINLAAVVLCRGCAGKLAPRLRHASLCRVGFFFAIL